eukprot:Rmarinus@m.9797
MSLRSAVADTAALSNRPPYSKKLQHPLWMVAEVDGMNKVVYESDCPIYLEKLKRKRRKQIISVIVLFIEDVPLQSLNLSILVDRVGTSKSFPTMVLVSMMITMVLIGVKLTKLFGAFKTHHYIRRVSAKLKTP